MHSSPTIISLSRRIFYLLFFSLTVCSLLFGLVGCRSQPDAEELRQRELRELEAQIPPYYLTATEIGDGYRFRGQGTIFFSGARCLESKISFPLGYHMFGFANYYDPESSRSISVQANKLEYYKVYDLNSLLSEQFDEECPRKWDEKDKHGDWHVVQATKVESLSHDAFGFRATEWYALDSASPSPSLNIEQLDTDKEIEVASTARAYGRVGDYFVAVYIDDKTADMPSEDDLKDLWDKQVEKLAQYIGEDNSSAPTPPTPTQEPDQAR